MFLSMLFTIGFINYELLGSLGTVLAGHVYSYKRVVLGRFRMRFVDSIHRFYLWCDSSNRFVHWIEVWFCIMLSTPLDSTTRPGGMREAIKYMHTCIYDIYIQRFAGINCGMFSVCQFLQHNHGHGLLLKICGRCLWHVLSVENVRALLVTCTFCWIFAGVTCDMWFVLNIYTG